MAYQILEMADGQRMALYAQGNSVLYCFMPFARGMIPTEVSVTYQNRCQKENLSGINRVEPGNTGKPRNIKGFRGILILKKALCDINNEKKAKTL